MGVILIAFEREAELSALEQLLAGKGHRVVRSGNGLAALDAARREPPHAIVSDIVLPRMDGFALCRKWKQDERLQSIPFLFYTRRHDDPKYERFALELGAERFLARSVSPEQLVTALDELLVNVPKPSGNGGSTGTMPLPTLDETVIQRPVGLDKAQRAAEAEKVARIAELENASRKHAAELEKVQRAAEAEKAARIAELESASRKQTAELEKLQRKEAEATERAQQAHSRLLGQIEELEATNKRLAAGEARFRRVFEANPLPMWIADHATGGFIAVNDAALALYGYNRAEFLALKGSSLEAPDAEDDAAPVAHQRKDGGSLKISLGSHEIEFDGRSADLVSAYDLTERAAAEQKLREEAVTLRKETISTRTLVEAAPDGCWILDSNGRLIDLNAAYCRMTGYSREELLGMNASQIEDQTAGETTMRLQLGRVQGGGRYETKHRCRDGSLLDVEVSVGVMEAGAAGDNMVLIRDVSERRREFVTQRASQRGLEFLVELFKQSESFDESAIVRRVIDQAADTTGSPLAYMYFVDPARKTIALAAWRDGTQPMATMVNAEARPLARAGLFTECVRARHPTSSNDLTRKPQQDGLPDLQRYLAVPMISGDATVAVLGVANREAGYGEEDQRALSALADGVWRVLESKRAHAATLGSLQRTDVALQGMIDSMVRMVERHDPYTAGSSRRLAALAVALGREAGLDGERQHALRVAALLHDIGNVGVPATILSKPAPLTETEIAIMRTHVDEGCQLLAEIDFGAPIADIIYQSHERYDGSGYPRGLKGEEILVEARILAIADTVEAMCSPRPYRPAAGMEAAIEAINKGAGRLYDLHLVAACTRLVRQHGFTLPE
ncbi:MAG TPA: HD domain-containing phosphohydrolase [Steroidobacteraceae bacterium]|jgi:PAS domain S-box-containing protein|nr:HD domain-containing phosphohydrolase [Steroidobacteraceae bacterium]